MRVLKDVFKQAHSCLSELMEKAERKTFFSEADFFGAVELLSRLDREQKRCVLELALDGVDDLSIEKIEEIQEIRRQRKEMEEKVARLREVVDRFLSIRCRDENCIEKLLAEQNRISGCDDEKLLKMDQSQELENYRQFNKYVEEQPEYSDMFNLAKYFDYPLVMALFGRQMYFGEEPVALRQENISNEEGTTLSDLKEDILSTEDSVATDEEDLSVQCASDEGEPLIGQGKEVRFESLQKSKEESGLLPPVSDVSRLGIIATERSKKSQGTKVFERMCKDPALRAGSIHVLNSLYDLAVYSQDMVSTVKDSYRTSVEAFISRMYKEGYVTRHTLEYCPGAVLYCLSENGRTMIEKPIAQRVLKKTHITCCARELKNATEFVRFYWGQHQFSRFWGEEESLFCTYCEGKSSTLITLSQDENAPTELILLPAAIYLDGDEGLDALKKQIQDSLKNHSENVKVFLSALTKEEGALWKEYLRKSVEIPDEIPILYGLLGADEYWNDEGNACSLDDYIAQIRTQEPLPQTPTKDAEPVSGEASFERDEERVADDSLQEESAIEESLYVEEQETGTVEINDSREEQQILRDEENSEETMSYSGLPGIESSGDSIESSSSISEEMLVDAMHDGEKPLVFSVDKVTSVEADSMHLTPQTLLGLNRIPEDDEFCKVIHGILCDEAMQEDLPQVVVNAVLLARGAGLVTGYHKSNRLSAQLRLATNLLLDECNYSSEFLATVFEDAEESVPVLVLAAYMYALLTPAVTYDYGLKTRTELYLSDFDVYFEGLTEFKALFNKLMSVRDVKVSGFTPAVIALLGDDAESERFIKVLSREASGSLTVNIPRTKMKALPIFYNSEFGIGSDLYQCMDYIAQRKMDADSMEWIEAILTDYCDVNNGEYSLNENKIEERLNQAWNDANPKNKFKLDYDARNQALRQYRQRVSVMIKWVEHIQNKTGNKQDVNRLKVLRKDILTLISDVRDQVAWRNVKDSVVLAWLLDHMENYLMGSVSNIEIYYDMLYTGVFSLSNDGVPEIDTSLGNLKYYEVWRNALRHIVAPRRSVEDITAEILGETLDSDAGLKDNLRQLSLLGVFSESTDEVFVVSDEQAKEAADSADIRTERFKDDLELAYTYYQINETEKETLSGIMNQHKSAFYEIGDFATWRRFIEALEMQIQEFANGRKKGLCSRLNACLEKDSASSLLIEAERLLVEDSNFAVAEEYLNRYESGERELDSIVLFDNDYFSNFLDPSVYDPLLQECIRSKGRSLKTFGWNYLEKHLPKDWTARLRDDSKALVSNWPVRKDTATPIQVQGLLKGLGFDVIKATKVSGRKEELWQLSVKPTARSLADYLHPIASFGTQMKSPLHIIFLYGNYTEQQLVDTITSMNLGTMSIVFIDRPIDAAGRRYIGEIFHTQKTGQNPFLLVDQVLLLYLAMHQETERLPALLKCTLPYATYQPFVRDGGSTADEMFCGRTLELATIIDPNGACVVYGGRQLGKTALLERAESRCSKPENKAYAVYSNIIRKKSEPEVVETLLNDINRKTDGAIVLKACKTIREMCAQLSELFRIGQIVSMHLLIDEVDDFLGAIAGEKYAPIQPLIDLKRETKNNFKFVVAGLHNVCRAKNATEGNGVFGQLGTPLCIKPLSPTDALQLLSKPLRYLGFQIDRYPHLETILTNTNYYPGILQFFGYILVETLTGQYSKYYHAAEGNPPFTLQDEQLGAVMNSADLNKSIKDKFRWSLELDPRYFMIARCITLLYHMFEEDRTSGSWHGFSVDDIMSTAEIYSIQCLENVSKGEYIVLMDEMVEMGILGKPNEHLHFYRLRRSSFVDIIGESLDVLEAEIIGNNKEV